MLDRLFLLLSRISFPAVIICLFILPFITITCQDKEISSARGIDLITGDIEQKGIEKPFDEKKLLEDISEEEPENAPEEKKGSPNGFIIAILAVAIIGSIATFFKHPNQKTFIMASAALGLILLVTFSYFATDSLKNLIPESYTEGDKYVKEIAEMFKVKMQVGFYACLFFFLLVFVAPMLEYLKEEQIEND